MPCMDAQHIEKALTGVVNRYGAVRSAYFFGSMASGFGGLRSDVDVALRIDSALSAQKAFSLRLKLMDELESATGRPVDVVLLNFASLKMIHQVLKSGKCIYAADPEDEILFGIQKRKEYFDFRHYLKDEKMAMKAFFDA